MIAIVIFPSSLSAQSSAPVTSPNPLNAAEYGKLLDRIEGDLGVWEFAIAKIDPGKGDTSYKVGSETAKNQDLGLTGVKDARMFIGSQRTRRTIYGELALAGYLDDVRDAITQLAVEGAFNDLSDEKMSSFGGEMGSVQISLKNDGMRRLKSLEDSPCSR